MESVMNAFSIFYGKKIVFNTSIIEMFREIEKTIKRVLESVPETPSCENTEFEIDISDLCFFITIIIETERYKESTKDKGLDWNKLGRELS